MPIFSYVAINDDGKEVRGSIESTDADAAKKALDELHMEVREVSEATRKRDPQAMPSSDQPPTLLVTFAFEGTEGSSGTVRRGTIQASNKFEAFQKLQSGQKLFLSMLSPLGVLPQFKDRDLEQWQAGTKSVSPSQETAKETPKTSVQKQPKKIGFGAATQVPPLASSDKTETPLRYQSIGSTLRLYAGWLLAWYGLFVALGYYATERSLPWEIPFVRAFYYSPLIFSFTVAIFLFLLVTTLQRTLKTGLLGNIAFIIVGAGVFLGVRLSL